MADYTEIIQEINTNIPDNNTQAITAAKLRTTLTDMLGAIDDVQQEFEGDVNETLSTFVEDTLYSTDTDKALSANQGYNLAATRNKLIVEGNNETLVLQPKIPVQQGHTYRLTLSTTNITMNNISLGTQYARLYVAVSDTRIGSSPNYLVLVSVPVDSDLKDSYEFNIPTAEEGNAPYMWLTIQSRFDAGQTLVYYLDDITELKELDDKISPKIITLSKSNISNEYTLEVSNKFPVCQFNSSNIGLFKYYAIGKNWNTLLESGTNNSHRTYRIPVDPEKYVMCSMRIWGSAANALACLVDENDIVVACITNTLGTGNYWTGNIIPKTAKYLIMPYYTSSANRTEVAFIPKINYISQNEEKLYSSIAEASNITPEMFGIDNPVFGGGYEANTSIIYAAKGNLGKYTVDDLLSSFLGTSTKQIFKLLYVEGYDEIDFRGYVAGNASGMFMSIDRDGNIIDFVNNEYFYYNNYKFPAKTCFFAYRGTQSGYEAYNNVVLKKTSLKPIELPTLPLKGIGLTPGKLGINGELNNFSPNELYWTTSYIDLSRGFTIKVNDGFEIVKGVLYKTDGTVANPYFFDKYDSTYTFYSVANSIPGYMLRLTIGVKDATADSKPITKYDSVIKMFTYLDNPDLTKVVPTDKPYENYKHRLNKILNVSEIARFDQWMDHYDNWNNEGQSIPMTSATGEGPFWNTRFREGWYEVGVPYSSPLEYSKNIGQNISLKTYVTAVQNKRSVLYTERINSSVVNGSTIGSKVSKYGYTYRGQDSHYSGPYYGTICTGLTGYLMGQRNIYISGDYMRRNEDNTGPRIPNLQLRVGKYYADVITDEQWENIIDSVQPMDFIWQPGHCSAVSDVYKDYNGKTQLIVWSEQLRPFTISRAFTRDEFRGRLQRLLDNNSAFGILYYTDWDNVELDDDFNDDNYFSTSNWDFKSNIQIDPDITTFKGEYATFQIGDSTDNLNDFKAYLNIHRGVNKYNYLQIYNEDDTEMTTTVKQIGISASETYPSDTLYPEDAYDKEDWIIFDLTDAEKMDGVLGAGRYKARLYNSNNGTYSGFTHFEFVDFSFNANLDGTSIKASWSNFSENATPYLIRQEYGNGLSKTDGTEYPSSLENRSGQSYTYIINTPSATDETVFTLTSGQSWGSAWYTKIFVKGTYGCVARRIRTIN
jgi:hypothetical protein